MIGNTLGNAHAFSRAQISCTLCVECSAYGIKQTWEFAHPSNKKYTGPLSRFVNLLKSETYKMLINHLDSEIIEVFKSSNQYGFEITILGNDKKYYKFQWVVEKYYDEGPLKDCWLTTSVSNPVSLGSSI